MLLYQGPSTWRRADPPALKRAGKKKPSRPDSDPSPPEDSDSNGSNGSKAGQDASSRQPCPPQQEDDAVLVDIYCAQRILRAHGSRGTCLRACVRARARARTLPV